MSAISSSSLISGVCSPIREGRSGSFLVKGKDGAFLAGKVGLYAVGTLALIGGYGVCCALGLTHIGIGGWSETGLKYPIGLAINQLGLAQRFQVYGDYPIIVHLWDRFHEHATKEWFHKIKN